MYTVEKFLALKKAPGTKKTYRKALLAFARFKFPKSKDPLKDLEKYAGNKKNDFVPDVIAFVESRKDKSMSTTGLYTTVIKLYLDVNGITFNNQEFRGMTPPREQASGTNDAPTHELLKRMFNAGNAHQRALVSLMACTGARIGECALIRISDVDFVTDPVRICLRKEYQKGHTKSERVKNRYIFLTGEARACLLQWMSERDHYCENLVSRMKNLQHPYVAGDRLFGMTQSGLYHSFMTCLQKVETPKKDTVTGHFNITPHSMRRWFRSTAPQGGLSVDVVNLLMGHLAGLDPSYLRMEPDVIATEFKKAEYVLTINRDEKMPDVQKSVESQSTQLAAVMRENAALMDRLKQIEQVTTQIEQERSAIRAAGTKYVKVEDIERMIKKAVSAALNGKK